MNDSRWQCSGQGRPPSRSNPFSFGKLLTHGPRLRWFAMMEVLNNFGSMRAIWQTTDTLRMELLGWGPAERSEGRLGYILPAKAPGSES